MIESNEVHLWHHRWVLYVYQWVKMFLFYFILFLKEHAIINFTLFDQKQKQKTWLLDLYFFGADSI